MVIKQQRYKMYKSGKAWTISGLVGLTVLFGGAVPASADQTVRAAAPQQRTAAAQPTSKPSAEWVPENQPAAQTPQPVDSATKIHDSVAGTPAAPTTYNGRSDLQVISGGGYEAANGQVRLRDAQGQLVTGLVEYNGHRQFFDQNGYQVKGQLFTLDGLQHYADPTSGNLVTGVQQIAGQTYFFNDFGTRTVDGLYVDKENDLAYWLENGQPFVGQKTVALSADDLDRFMHYGQKDITANQPAAVTGYAIQTDRDGHIQHRTDDAGVSALNGDKQPQVAKVTGDAISQFNQQGQQAVVANAQLPDNRVVAKHNYAEQNAAHDTTAQSFTGTVDGYLTVDTWYRPKAIHDNGETWRASRADDFRPLLMAWSPDRTSQVNYLKHMITNYGLAVDTRALDQANAAALAGYMAQVQDGIERDIAKTASVARLRDLMTTFIDSQASWNGDKQKKLRPESGRHLQDAALTYRNSTQTPEANSNFRIMNRVPSRQNGQQNYYEDLSRGFLGELLLANDVDNSNPAVQAEQLNWIHFLMSFGEITDNDPEANFDGIRIDAVDNVNADLQQIAADYAKARYKTTSSDKQAIAHLSIQEDWSPNDALYTRDQGNHHLTMDDKLRTQLLFSLGKPVVPTNSEVVGYADQCRRDRMQRFMDFKLVDRSANSTENEAIPNYSLVRAHDSGVQTVLAHILRSQHPKFRETDENGGTPAQNVWTASREELKAALAEYRSDMFRARKHVMQHNIVSAHAMMLTNKDTVPRLYYGDFYMEDTQYMAEKSPYFDALDTLLKARQVYVSGGQSMAVDSNDVLTSVRYGKGAMTAQDAGTSDTRTQGVGTIISNNPTLKLAAGATVTLAMGVSHANQDFRALILPSATGFQTFTSDAGAPIKRTNAAGELIFTADEISGYENTQLSGYLSVWVPVGAASGQDARTAPSDVERHDGQTFRSNAALDSQVIYEGFATFQETPTTASEFTNVIIAQNTALFQSWGVTSFQFAPQYRASTDASFLDAIMANGYAFTDRYDLGFDTPTKYGTATDLRQAIKALHRAGIQAMADFVPDQVYNLPGREVVTAAYTDSFGKPIANHDDAEILYASQTKGGGDYQKKYGGEFIAQIKRDFPEIFERRQVSTGLPLADDVKIKSWSAKYFNGTNAQNIAKNTLLRDDATAKYFRIGDATNTFLPDQLTTGAAVVTGFDRQEQTYYSYSGKQAQDAIITAENGERYYVTPAGMLATQPGLITCRGEQYYVQADGRLVRDTILTLADGETYRFSQSGRMMRDCFWQVTRYGSSYKNIGYFGTDGKLVRDQTVTLAGHIYQATASGVFVMNRTVTDRTSQHAYNHEGQRLIACFGANTDGSYSYYDNHGNAVTGHQQIDGQSYFFDRDYKQVKGQWVKAGASYQYYQGENGVLATNRFLRLVDGRYVYVDDHGCCVTGIQVIAGQQYYFDKNYKQVKGQWVDDGTGYHYYYANNGCLATDCFFRNSSGNWSGLDARGNKIAGRYVRDGKAYYFDKNYNQVKGQWVDDGTGYHYYSADNGEKAVARFQLNTNRTWSYLDQNGDRVTGELTLAGQTYFFDKNGEQVKGDFRRNRAGQTVFYDASRGQAVLNGFVTGADGARYHLTNGNIDKGWFWEDNHWHCADQNTGRLVTNRTWYAYGHYYTTDHNGRLIRFY